MERERRDSGPPLPPGPGGAYPVLVSFAIVVFLLDLIVRRVRIFDRKKTVRPSFAKA